MDHESEINIYTYGRTGPLSIKIISNLMIFLIFYIYSLLNSCGYWTLDKYYYYYFAHYDDKLM